LGAPSVAIFTELTTMNCVDAKKISISIGKAQLAMAKKIARLRPVPC